MRRIVAFVLGTGMLAACGRIGFTDAPDAACARDAPLDTPTDPPIDTISDPDPCATTDLDGDGVTCATDCDDADNRVFPGQTQFFATARASGGYDYNCDTVDEQEDPDPVTCTDNGMGQCAGDGWFVPVPACGESQLVGGCGGAAGACEVLGFGERTQACR